MTRPFSTPATAAFILIALLAATAEAQREPTPERALDPSPNADQTTPALRLGVAPQARLATAEAHVLWGLELNAKVALSELVALAVEGSYAANELALGYAGFDLDFDVQLWNAACGVDLNVPGVSGLSVGPRISLAHASLAPTDSSLGASFDDTAKLLGLLGARAGLSVPLGTRVSMDLAIEALHTLGNGPQYEVGVGVVSPGDQSLSAFRPLGSSELEGWMLTAALGIAVRL
jgi:hypothetical protein